MMNETDDNPTSQRIYRELTREERARVDKARAEAAAKRDEIVREGRIHKAAWDAARREVARTIADLKSHREQLGLSLADVQARSGLMPSAISRLENDPNANPTILTLQRYATALGLHVEIVLDDQTD